MATNFHRVVLCLHRLSFQWGACKDETIRQRYQCVIGIDRLTQSTIIARDQGEVLQDENFNVFDEDSWIQRKIYSVTTCDEVDAVRSARVCRCKRVHDGQPCTK
jgi:hypothetical protein